MSMNKTIENTMIYQVLELSKHWNKFWALAFKCWGLRLFALRLMGVARECAKQQRKMRHEYRINT